MADNFIEIKIKESEYRDLLDHVDRMHDSIDPRWLKSTQRRNIRPMVEAMKANSKSTRIAKMIGVTTAKRRAGELGVKVGVIKNDPDQFPRITAQALGSLIEYGSEGERFRRLAAGEGGGGVSLSGSQSTGVMPAAPFLRPAWDTHVRGFMDKTEDSIIRKVMKEV